MNRAIHSAAAAECCVRRVYDGVDVELCDVAAKDVDSAIEVLHELCFS
jgi:hypothetical protein